MRVATVVLLAWVAVSFLGTARAADELEEHVLDDAGAPAPSDAPPAADSAQVERMQAIGICEQTVAERLENPSAAHWPDRGQYRVTKQGSGQFAGTLLRSWYIVVGVSASVIVSWPRLRCERNSGITLPAEPITLP